MTFIVIAWLADLLPITSSSLHFSFLPLYHDTHSTCTQVTVRFKVKPKLPNLPLEAPHEPALTTMLPCVQFVPLILFSIWEDVIKILLVSFIPMSDF